jgi:hypothetical protein
MLAESTWDLNALLHLSFKHCVIYLNYCAHQIFAVYFSMFLCVHFGKLMLTAAPSVLLHSLTLLAHNKHLSLVTIVVAVVITAVGSIQQLKFVLFSFSKPFFSLSLRTSCLPVFAFSLTRYF